MVRRGKDPKRQIAPAAALNQAARAALAQRVQYMGSPLHKLHPGNYGFQPPVNPRPTKSVCDGVRIILRAEALALLQAGIMKGMVSIAQCGDVPKYVWTVDALGEVYEAKIIQGSPDQYKGYRLEEEDDMRARVLSEWRKR